MKDFRDTTIVITGASSGIGRATAECFARAGARLVLASRRAEALETVADVCRQLGGQALAVPTDVTDAAGVAALARRAAEFGGGVDVWINNAGVSAVGPFEDTPVDVHERVIRVNLIGSLYGAHAVLPYFKQQRRGVLVNLIGAWGPTPYAASYTASKHGLRAYSDALRAELHGWPDIRVCDIFPSVVDTPGFAHGANYTGKALLPPQPMYDARGVAQAILRIVAHPRRTNVSVGMVANVARLANVMVPKLVRRATARLFEAYFRRAQPAPHTGGALFQPNDGASQIDGGWRGTRRCQDNEAAVGVLGSVGLLALIVLSKLRR